MESLSPTSNSDAGIYDEYFRLTNEYKTKYGPKTVVLLQVGAFFEIYGLKRTETGDIYGSCISELSRYVN